MANNLQFRRNSKVADFSMKSLYSTRKRIFSKGRAMLIPGATSIPDSRVDLYMLILTATIVSIPNTGNVG